jgi:hypothetical protein
MESHLIDPIRPTREHIAISPHDGLYAMPSLCRDLRYPGASYVFDDKSGWLGHDPKAFGATRHDLMARSF